MTDEEDPLKLLSEEELEASLKPASADAAPATSSYTGPDRRKTNDRRNGPGDRRELLRFEPEKEKADRRGGRDRRKANNNPEDLWEFRDI